MSSQIELAKEVIKNVRVNRILVPITQVSEIKTDLPAGTRNFAGFFIKHPRNEIILEVRVYSMSVILIRNTTRGKFNTTLKCGSVEEAQHKIQEIFNS